jgi:hypothetical protein
MDYTLDKTSTIGDIDTISTITNIKEVICPLETSKTLYSTITTVINLASTIVLRENRSSIII